MAPSNRVAPEGGAGAGDDTGGEGKGHVGKKTSGKAAPPAEKDQKAKGSPTNAGQARQQGSAARLNKKGPGQEKGSPLGGGGPIGSRPPGPRPPVSARCAEAVFLLETCSAAACGGE